MTIEYATPRYTNDSVTARITSRAVQLQPMVAGLLARHSITALRISLGLVFLGFGVLKFFPGVSPAQGLVIRTLETLSLGMVAGHTAMVVAAVTECFIGITLITGKLLRVGLVVLAGALVGFFSPLVLFFNDMFPGGPTLEAQYILKDIVLAAAGMVVAARALGARLVTGDTTR